MKTSQVFVRKVLQRKRLLNTKAAILSGELHLNNYEIFLMAMISFRQFLKLMSLSFNSVDSLLFLQLILQQIRVYIFPEQPTVKTLTLMPASVRLQQAIQITARTITIGQRNIVPSLVAGVVSMKYLQNSMILFVVRPAALFDVNFVVLVVVILNQIKLKLNQLNTPIDIGLGLTKNGSVNKSSLFQVNIDRFQNLENHC